MHNYKELRLVLVTNYTNNDLKDKIITNIVDIINRSGSVTSRTYISSNANVRHSFMMTKYKYSKENIRTITMLKNYWSNIEGTLLVDEEHRILIIDECIDHILNHDEETYKLIEGLNNSKSSNNVTCIYAIKDQRDIPPTIIQTFDICPCIKIDVNNEGWERLV